MDRLSFEIAKGEIVAVLGETGFGKSTMSIFCAGLIEPTSGKVEVTGHEPFAEFNFFRGKIGIVFQNDRLMPCARARQRVVLGCKFLNKRPARPIHWRGAGWSGSASPATRTTIRMRCPAECASASRSRGPSRSSRNSVVRRALSSLDE